MKVDEKAPERFRFIGQRLPRPDVPAKVTGHHRYLHDLVLPCMLHARVIRPPALGTTLVSVDESSIAGIGGARSCTRYPTRRCGRRPSAHPVKVANTFAVESFTDEIAARTQTAGTSRTTRTWWYPRARECAAGGAS